MHDHTKTQSRKERLKSLYSRNTLTRCFGLQNNTTPADCAAFSERARRDEKIFVSVFFAPLCLCVRKLCFGLKAHELTLLSRTLISSCKTWIFARNSGRGSSVIFSSLFFPVMGHTGISAFIRSKSASTCAIAFS